MIEFVNSASTMQKKQRNRILHRCGWLMGLGLISSGVAIAQVPLEPGTIAASSTTEGVTTESPRPPQEFIPPVAPLSAPLPSVYVESPELDSPIAAETSDTEFLDQTRYDVGATQRIKPLTQQPYQPSFEADYVADRAPASFAPVQVGPLSLSATGISWSDRTVNAVQRPYFRRSFRPLGRLGNGNQQLLFPLAIPASITSIFGWRIHPISGTKRFHTGTDLGAPLGTPVLAAYGGRVILADVLGGYGFTIVLEHQQGTQQTLYAHLSEMLVQPGELVQQGAVIGRVGSTGNSTGPHLHFELRQLTQEGWVALDGGQQLEYALAQLMQLLQAADTVPKKPGAGRS